MEKRLIELETRIAFQESTIEQLDQIVSSQQQQISQLQVGFSAIKKLLKEVQISSTINDGEERPPHY